MLSNLSFLIAFSVADLFTTVGEILNGLLELLIQATSGIVPIFYDSGAEGGGFTIYGVFLLFGLGIFFLMFAWRVIQGFIPRR